MSLLLWKGTAAALTPYDLAANRITRAKLSLSYNHPATFRFVIVQPEQTYPFDYNDFIAVGDADSAYDSLENPLFEGHVAEINPQSANEIEVVAYDPTARAGREITVMNGLHSLGSVYPRVVFNCNAETDDDYAFGLTSDATAQTIVQTIFSNALPELQPLGAAPLGGGDAFVGSDLAGFAYKPQDKIVFETTPFRQALDHFLALYPQFKIVFAPGERRWRFINVKTSPTTTNVLNSYPRDGSGLRTARWILSKNLKRVVNGHYSAVKIFGPETLADGDVSLSDGTLQNAWSAGDASNVVIDGELHLGNGARRWRIVDPAKRHLARILKTPKQLIAQLQVNAGQLASIFTAYKPALVVTWNGSDWYVVQDIFLDTNLGYVYAPQPVVRYRQELSPHWIPPTNARFVFSYYTPPLTARYPVSGFGGTLYSVGGLATEQRLYDEQLAVGYQRFTAYTTAQRIEQFQLLAQNLWEARSDIAYAGGFMSLGHDADHPANPMDYEFIRLNRRVNFAAVDGSGGSLTTGWENINAIVTDAEYDFGERTTVVTLSSDLLSVVGSNPDELKRQLLGDLKRQRMAEGVVFTINAPSLGLFARSTPFGANDNVNFPTVGADSNPLTRKEQP